MVAICLRLSSSAVNQVWTHADAQTTSWGEAAKHAHGSSNIGCQLWIIAFDYYHDDDDDHCYSCRCKTYRAPDLAAKTILLQVGLHVALCSQVRHLLVLLCKFCLKDFRLCKLVQKAPFCSGAWLNMDALITGKVVAFTKVEGCQVPVGISKSFKPSARNDTEWTSSLSSPSSLAVSVLRYACMPDRLSRPISSKVSPLLSMHARQAQQAQLGMCWSNQWCQMHWQNILASKSTYRLACLHPEHKSQSKQPCWTGHMDNFSSWNSAAIALIRSHATFWEQSQRC